MSNVLIGIIGVILFIGLALAGALFLGPRFQQSKSASTASAIANQLQQVASAIAMNNLETGTTMTATNWSTNVNTLAPGYLKSIPNNPVNGAGYTTNDAAGGAGAGPVRIVKTELGPDTNTVARDVCSAIERNTGGDGVIVGKTDFVGTISSKGTVGCFLYSPQSVFYAYITV